MTRDPRAFPFFVRRWRTSMVAKAAAACCGGERDYLEQCGSGNFWMQLLTGEHVSTDFAVVAGEIAWCRHASGIWGSAGAFDYWVVEEGARPRLERFCAAWIRMNLTGYTGMVNLETVGGRISTARLRFFRPVAGPVWAKVADSHRPSASIRNLGFDRYGKGGRVQPQPDRDTWLGVRVSACRIHACL